MNKKLLITAAATTALLFGISACGDEGGDGSDGSSASEKKDQEKNENGEGQGQGQQELPEPDLEGIPNVVAEVNGEQIKKDEFVAVYEGQFQQQAMSGGEVDEDKLKKDTANSMVETELLVQEASEQGFKASDKDVNQELKSMAEQNSMKPKEFMKAMDEQGMGEDQVRSQLKDQLQVQDLLDEESGDIQPSDKELRERYDELKKQQEQQGQGGQPGQGGQQAGELPPFKEVKGQLEEQMVSEKQGEVAQGLIKDLKEDAKINVKV